MGLSLKCCVLAAFDRVKMDWLHLLSGGGSWEAHLIGSLWACIGFWEL